MTIQISPQNTLSWAFVNPLSYTHFIDSVGTAPGLLWTIFVGATFGTVNEKGVDGNQEFEGNNVRKGVVLGLGIGLGVVALIGTGIYARKGQCCNTIHVVDF